MAAIQAAIFLFIVIESRIRNPELWYRIICYYLVDSFLNSDN